MIATNEIDLSGGESRKRRHRLNTARNPNEFRALMDDAGVSFESELAKFIDPASNYGVMLVGSLAEGTGTASSDVDLMILLDSVEQLKSPPGTIFLDVGAHREVLRYLNGIEVNFAFVVREHLREITNAFIAIAPALYDPRDLRSLPMLEINDLRIVHRIRKGWPLHGNAIVDMWRDELMVDLLPQYLTIRYYVEMNEFTEDAEANIGGPPGAAGLILRTATLQGMLSVLAHEGLTGQNHNWIIHWCESIEDKVARDLVTKAREMIVEAAPMDVDGERQFYSRLLTLRTRVREFLEEDVELRKAIAYLSEEINYVDTKE